MFSSTQLVKQIKPIINSLYLLQHYLTVLACWDFCFFIYWGLESFLIMHLFSISFVFGAYDYGMAMLGRWSAQGRNKQKRGLRR